MTRDGRPRTQIFRFSDGRFAVKTFHYCAKCDMEVDEFQWENFHSKHPVPIQTEGAAVEIPETYKLKTMVAGCAD